MELCINDGCYHPFVSPWLLRRLHPQKPTCFTWKMGANRTRVLFYIPSGKKQRSSTNMVLNCWVKQMFFVSRVHWSLQCFFFRSPAFFPRRLMRNRSNRSTGNMNKVKTENEISEAPQVREKVNKVQLTPNITPLRKNKGFIAGLEGFTNWWKSAIKPSQASPNFAKTTEPGWRKGGGAPRYSSKPPCNNRDVVDFYGTCR